MNCIYRLALRVIVKDYQVFLSDVIHPSQKAMLEEREIDKAVIDVHDFL